MMLLICWWCRWKKSKTRLGTRQRTSLGNIPVVGNFFSDCPTTTATTTIDVGKSIGRGLIGWPMMESITCAARQKRDLNTLLLNRRSPLRAWELEEIHQCQLTPSSTANGQHRLWPSTRRLFIPSYTTSRRVVVERHESSSDNIDSVPSFSKHLSALLSCSHLTWSDGLWL